MRKCVVNVYTSHSQLVVLVPSDRGNYHVFSQIFGLIVIFQNNVDYNLKKNDKNDSNVVPST